MVYKNPNRKAGLTKTVMAKMIQQENCRSGQVANNPGGGQVQGGGQQPW